MSFLTLAFGKLWFIFNLRTPRSKMIRNEITRNRWVWGALALCSLLLIAAVYVPLLSRLLQTQSLGLSGWGLVLGMSMIPLLVGQVVREAQRRTQDR